ncbi:MAG: LysM peptidoglycan-binding domain-containing protein [Burkholderiaceae bacterium]|jgi:hypothetical protein|nr:MAG: LysM peptidoglycan-binding domain-containing protein [Burkholderiaceae bacterium]
MTQLDNGGKRVRRWGAALTGLGFVFAGVPAYAQQGIHSAVTSGQRATAQHVAARGVPLSELAPNAPDQYTVRRGDTLWAISGKFLKAPWHWPQLWGMNLQQIRNPNLIYPGQELFLERVNGRALLRVGRAINDGGEGPTVRVSPRNRVEALAANPIPTLQMSVIGPFLAEPLVVDDNTFAHAPRIVALGDDARALIAQGDRAYARGPDGAPLLKTATGPTEFRIFRSATPLKDPITGEILGYEGQYVGQARLVKGESESTEPVQDAAAPPAAGEASFQPPAGPPKYLPIPATIDIVSSKEEIRAGDHLLPEPPPSYIHFVPHAPAEPVDARVVSIYGNAVRFAGSNQVVAINKGERDGIEDGQVLEVLSTGRKMVDKTDAQHEMMQLPDERNGLAMVFKVFDRVSYVLVMQATHPIQVNDRMVNPR